MAEKKRQKASKLEIQKMPISIYVCVFTSTVDMYAMSLNFVFVVRQVLLWIFDYFFLIFFNPCSFLVSVLRFECI